MALSSLDKMRINKYVKETPVGGVYYSTLCKALKSKKKVSYPELLEFFTKYVIDSLNNDKRTIKTLSKYVYCIKYFFVLSKKSGVILDDILLGEIRLVVETYNNCLNDKRIEKSNDLNDLIFFLDRYLEGNYPVKDEEQTLSYIKEINSLQEQIKQLAKDLDEQVKIYNALNKKLKDSESKLTKKTEEVVSLKKENEKSSREIEELREKIKKLNYSVIVLNKQVEELEETNREFSSNQVSFSLLKEQLEKEIDVLIKRINELESILLAKEELLKSYADKERRESLQEIRLVEEENIKEKIKDIILNKLASGGVILDELVAELSSQDYDVSRELIFSYLNEIRNEINIGVSSLSSSPKYIIVPPNVVSNETFDIDVPLGCKSYDILLISDLHFSKFDEQVINEYNKVLDYCAANSVKLILNLGDFFCFKYPYKTDMLQGLTSSKKIVEKAISKLPVSDGIYHAILGGNHDKDALTYGFDSIKMLTDAREDFVSLGYDHVTITFNGQKNLLHSFMLHHPSTKFGDPVLDDKFDNESLAQSLGDYYTNMGRRRRDSYLDVIGHFHRSGLDSFNSICTVPSLFFDRYNNGAWHLKVYFDEETNFKYMVFKPLDLEDKLVATTEIYYQKLTLK